MKGIKNFFAGICVGIANSIPGVSGGTILVILGKFERLMKSIANLFRKDNKDRFNDIFFIAVIIIGALVGIVLFSLALEPLLWFNYIPVMYFFIGLIIVSTYFIFNKEVGSLKNIKLVYLLIGIAIVALPSLLLTKELGTKPSIPTNLSLLPLLNMLLVGVIGGLAMILPGVSGSMVLLLLGYYYVLYQGYVPELADFNLELYVLVPLFVFGIGVLVGIFLGGKLCVVAMKNYRLQSYNAIVGMLLGSAIALVPFKSEHMVNIEYDKLGNEIARITYSYDLPTILISIGALIVGGIIIYLLESSNKTKNESN